MPRPDGPSPHRTGVLHHIEINVSELRRSAAFWGWFLQYLGYKPYQEWQGGRSWRLGDTYIVSVQVEPGYENPPYHRRRVGLIAQALTRP